MKDEFIQEKDQWIKSLNGSEFSDEQAFKQAKRSRIEMESMTAKIQKFEHDFSHLEGQIIALDKEIQEDSSEFQKTESGYIKTRAIQ